MLHPITFLSSRLLEVVKKEGENLPSVQKAGYLKTGMAGVHLPGSHRGLLQLNTSSSPAGTHQWLLPWQGWHFGPNPLLGPDGISFQASGCYIILALLTHNSNKSTCFMRISRGLENAVSAGKGTQGFLAESCPVNSKAGSSDQGPGPSGEEPDIALLCWSDQSWCMKIKRELTVLNFLSVYSSGCHQAVQRGFAGLLRAWENQCV